MMETKRRRNRSEKVTMQYRTYTRVGEKQMLKSEHVVERRLPTFSVDVFSATAIAFVLATIAGIAYTESYRDGFLVGSIFALLIFMWRLRYVHDRNALSDSLDDYEDEEEEEEISRADPLIVKIYRPDGTPIMFRQPAVASFANWIRQVVKDAKNDRINFNQKVTLSQRQALSRSWSAEEWRIMIDLFEENGWVFRGRNSVPEPTELGLGVFHAYLNMLPPTRPEYMS